MSSAIDQILINRYFVKWLTYMKEHIGWNLRNLDQLFARTMEEKLGYPVAQLRVLGFVSGRGDDITYQKDIERMFMVSRAAVSTTIDKMEKSGLLKRCPSERDRRQKYVKVTEKGFQVAELCYKNLMDMEDSLVEYLGKEDVASFLEICSRIRERLEEF